MSNQTKKWEVLSKDNKKNIIDVLLENRGIKTEKDKTEFLNPTNPVDISLKSLGVKESVVKRLIDRINFAKKRNEQVIIYGDYDADGITATAIIWEALHEYGLDVLPHIPDRFEEGYGINPKSVEDIKSKIPNLKLIVTVDNGIVGYGGINRAKELGIDTIVIDHHLKGTKKLATDLVLHTTEVCGSALAWFFSKELGIKSGLELAAIGTIADQMPLIGINRSIVKYGLKELNKTKRPGFHALFKDSKIEKIGTYEVNYIIAPRINAMGRLKNGIDSLRLICTKSLQKAKELAGVLTKTNIERQKIVDQVLIHAMGLSKGKIPNVVVLSHESYHEGVIGLAAGKLVEEYYRPAIVLSKNGEKSKASARSITGFNIIEAIRETGLILEGGGHPMAAGFSIETIKIEEFTKKINLIASKILTGEILQRRLKIDGEMNFDEITPALNQELKTFEPSGIGNHTPTFLSVGVEVADVRTVGKDARHLKLRLRQNGHIFDSIYFSGGELYSKFTPDSKIDAVYQIEENVWNGRTSLQLKIRDIKID